MRVAWGVPNQHALHDTDLRWRCGCDPKHGANPACLNVGWRHTEPFHQCPECIANLGLNGFTGAVPPLEGDVTWLTPSELDREHWRWVRWKPQHGGWNQPLWVVLQDEWRRAVIG